MTSNLPVVYKGQWYVPPVAPVVVPKKSHKARNWAIALSTPVVITIPFAVAGAPTEIVTSIVVYSIVLGLIWSGSFWMTWCSARTFPVRSAPARRVAPRRRLGYAARPPVAPGGMAMMTLQRYRQHR
jgi:hypothetical protein